jgi:hypothetical protein
LRIPSEFAAYLISSPVLRRHRTSLISIPAGPAC